MAFCQHCGHKLEEGAPFCSGCGKPVPNNTDTEKTERQQVFEGEIHKCPNCGAEIPAFATVCPTCNYEFRGISAVSSVSELYTKLSSADSENEKIQLVKTFPIPNSREDIVEFMILASTNFNEDSYVSSKNSESLADAWLTKAEQCYQKAKISLRDDKGLNEITSQYEALLDRIGRAKTRKLINIAAPIACIAVGLVLVVVTNMFAIQTMGLVALGAGVGFLIKNKKASSQQAQTGAVVPAVSSKMTSKTTGYASWSTGTKILWIILNIYTIGIPAIIYACKNKNK